MKSTKSQRKFQHDKSVYSFSKRKAKKVAQNDYEKLALNAFHKLDYHILHNMISTFSGYPFFFLWSGPLISEIHTHGTFLLYFRVLGITISRSWSGLVRIFLNKNCNFIFHRLPQTNSWSCSHKGSHQSKEKLPTNIKRIEFVKRLLMLDCMKYHDVAVDGIH